MNSYIIYPTPFGKFINKLFKILCPKDVTQSNMTNSSTVSKNTECDLLLKIPFKERVFFFKLIQNLHNLLSKFIFKMCCL